MKRYHVKILNLSKTFPSGDELAAPGIYKTSNLTASESAQRFPTLSVGDFEDRKIKF